MLDRETILQATEKVLRRHGSAKATVVDVARVLGVSHGTVYRHFPSKAALREAVTRRWIERTHLGLADDDALAAPERLRKWLRTAFHAKRATALEDPELFQTYLELVQEQSGVAEDHVDDLKAQIAAIIATGVRDGDFAARDFDAVVQAVFDATTRFHHPAHAGSWTAPDIDDAFEAVCTLILQGLKRK